MLYALVADDKPGGIADRMAIRPDHLRHLESLGERLVLAGPFLDASGEPNGSIVIIEAASQDEAEALFRRDPFVVKGVFNAYQIRPWRLTINNTTKS